MTREAKKISLWRRVAVVGVMFVFVLGIPSLPGKPHLIYWGIALVVEVAICVTLLPFTNRDSMSRREDWRKVLQGELCSWSSMSSDEVLAELRTRGDYTVVAKSKQYQVEVELLEDTPEYLHVSVAVDNSSLPASIHPVSESFICRKAQAPSR